MNPLGTIQGTLNRVRNLPNRLIRNQLLGLLQNCDRGQLTVRDPFGKRTVGVSSETRAELVVEDSRFYPRLAFGGGIAMGETYRDGYWTSPDMVALLQYFVLNRGTFHDGAGSVNLLKPFRKLYHWTRTNTRNGARRNIREHYDLGNDFYETFLDETLTYSSAYFESEEESLSDAQQNKYLRLARKTQIQNGDRVLEIGTGWGGFAVLLAREYDVHVTTTTISREQYRYTNEQVEQLGLGDRIRVLEKDYRELNGNYDRIVSVEMIEAVGEEYLSNFFEKLDTLLKPDGTIGLQLIHMMDQFYDEYRNNVDFIQRYIFPGGHLPSLGLILEKLQETGLRVKNLEENGHHYDRTLQCWKDRFRDRQDEIRELGYDGPFQRLWEYYFSYCQAGFRTGLIGNIQVILDRPSIVR